jgi:hypothetical protein
MLWFAQCRTLDGSPTSCSYHTHPFVHHTSWSLFSSLIKKNRTKNFHPLPYRSFATLFCTNPNGDYRHPMNVVVSLRLVLSLDGLSRLVVWVGFCSPVMREIHNERKKPHLSPQHGFPDFPRCNKPSLA